MLNAFQSGGFEDMVRDKKRLFGSSTGAGILQDCQRRSPACQGHSRTSHGRQHFSRSRRFQTVSESAANDTLGAVSKLIFSHDVLDDLHKFALSRRNEARFGT